MEVFFLSIKFKTGKVGEYLKQVRPRSLPYLLSKNNTMLGITHFLCPEIVLDTFFISSCFNLLCEFNINFTFLTLILGKMIENDYRRDDR